MSGRTLKLALAGDTMLGRGAGGARRGQAPGPSSTPV